MTGCAWCEAPLSAATAPGGRLCERCGVATTDPWPTEADLDAAYADSYRPPSGRFTGPGDALLHWTRTRLARRIDAIAPAGPVLDIGAGDGALVRALRRRGRPAVGVERGDRDHDPLGRRFAAVVLWHALEHLRTPGRALDRAATLLVPGGVLIVAMPNADSLQARAFGDRWLALDRPRHLVHVPAGTLIARLRAAGLTVERTSHWRGGQVVFGWLHGLVCRIPGTGDLYDAIRRPQARQRGPLGGGRRAATLAWAAALVPAAAAAAITEVALRRAGSVYVEARRG